MKQLFICVFSLLSFASFGQIGSFRKVETDDIRMRTMLNTDITKFLTTDANGHLVLATVSGGTGTGGRFGIEDATTDDDRYNDMGHHELFIENAQTISLDAANGTNLAGHTITLSYLGSSESSANFSGLYAYDADGRRADLFLNGGRIKYKTTTTDGGEHYMPLTVNGIHADAAGNIDLTGGASLNKSLGSLASYNTTSQRNYLPRFTPKSTKDKRGDIGRVTFDDKYEYIKTAKGWKRLLLSNF